MKGMPPEVCSSGTLFQCSTSRIPSSVLLTDENRAHAPLQECFNLAQASDAPALSFGHLLTHRPGAVLSIIPEALVLFTAGAVAGAAGKTLTAPLDRVKILLQVKGGLENGAVRQAAASGGVLRSLTAIFKQEGLRGFWKGNIPQVLRVVPYSAAQLVSYEWFKGMLRDSDGNLSVPSRLTAGACAGMFSTLVTYPLDTLRLRLAVDPKLRSIFAASATLWREGGFPAFYRGLGPAMLGIAPYMALELAAFDLLPQEAPSFVRGFTAALLATSVFYPLDTVRRMIQLESTRQVSMLAAAQRTLASDGLLGLYRGFVPNALKNLPNKGIRLSTFDAAKGVLASSKIEYEDEVRQHRYREADKAAEAALAAYAAPATVHEHTRQMVSQQQCCLELADSPRSEEPASLETPSSEPMMLEAVVRKLQI